MRTMPTFRPNEPIVTQKPVVEVDPGLRPGTYRFQLVVEDDEGRRSAPDTHIVTILRPRDR
jgi:hypothetical protein